MDDELPTEREPLPSMLQLYENDVHAYPECHLDLPIKIAHGVCKAFPSHWPYLMDFIQEGNIALFLCMERMKEENGDRFRRYTAVCIRNAIYQYFARLPMIYIPPTSRRDVFLANNQTEALQKLEHCVSWEAINEAALQPSRHTQEREDTTKIQHVQQLLTHLPPTEKQAICFLYGLDGPEYRHDEIASKLGLTMSYIYTLRDKAIKRMSGDTGIKPARALTVIQQRERRKERCQEAYQQAHEKITICKLAQITGYTESVCEVFLREQRGYIHERDKNKRRARMEALYSEWQTSGKKITQKAFTRACHYNTNEVGAFLREKRKQE